MIERIINEMTLREPQAESLRKFTQLISGVDIKNMDQARVKRLLQTGSLSFPDDYARIAFALATGVGKTRLIGAIAAYLFLSGKAKHFVLLAPSSTILKKLKSESEISHPKYIFKGLSGFPVPEVVHADNIESHQPDQLRFIESPTLFILSPGQIRPRSGSEAERRLRREGEGFGQSFVNYLAGLNDLVIFLDEGHRYGQDSGIARAWYQAIIDLNPKLVIEMTATPSNPTTVLYWYDLKEALREGKYIKNVTAIVEQRQTAVTDDEWDKHSLLEGYRRLQIKKSAINAFRQNYPDKAELKPILLIAAQDTTHAAHIEQWLLSDEFLREVNAKIYQSNPLRDKLTTDQVLRVDITQSEDEIAKLLNVEKPDNKIEIVINVGMLKEGWDVTNVYVIVPLRAMVSVTLAIQTIGRGLRLPYGERVGNEEVDTLDVLAFGRDTVQDVIRQAKSVGVNVRQGISGGGNMLIKKVQPAKECNIKLPAIALKIRTPLSLKGLQIQHHVSIDLSETAKITRVEVQSGDNSVLSEALDLEVINPSKRLGQILCRDISDVGGQEDEATKIFNSYFEDKGCDNLEKQRRAFQKYGQQIYNDVRDQVENITRHLEAKYEHEDHVFDEMVFAEVFHSVPADNSIIDKEDALFPRDKQRLLEGWKKSLYPQNKFDTPDELTTAKIIDGADIVQWVRNPVRQFGIDTQAGKHYPDFVIIFTDKIVLLEVKNIDELNEPNSDACIKGEAAIKWCKMASEASTQQFEYWAIPNNRVSECATINDLKTKRFIFV